VILIIFDRYLFYVDDMAPKDPSSFSGFQQRFLSGQPQLNPILDALAKVLLRMWDLYDPLCANTIIISAFEMVTMCCMEPEIEKLPLVRGVRRFPWYVRQRNGVGPAYGFMVFPKSTQINIMEYIHAIPDMDRWICLTNDILSSVLLFLLSPCVI
jgi:Trichodiene synthase (TRI5)